MPPLSSGTVALGEDGDADETFYKAGFTDGLPVVLPTRGRVLRMLRGTSLQAHDVLGRCPPSYFDVTVEKLAIAAVMAGCTPEMFRIVVAACKAMLSTEFGLHGVHATTMGATPVVVVNGPCRHDAAVNFRHAPCGSGSRSTSIGRALKLLLQNVGRAKLAGTESTTIGTPMKFGMCFAEWEERAAEWEPLAATNSSSARRGEDAVTVIAATSGPVQIVDTDSRSNELLDRLAKAMAVAYAPQTPLINHCLLVVSPEHYDTLLKGGVRSKRELAEALWKRSGRHVLPYLGWIIKTLFKYKFPKMPPLALRLIGFAASAAGSIAYALGLPLNLVPKFSSPDSFKIVVAGGDGGKFSSFMPSFGVGRAPMSTANMSTPVTVGVEPRPESLDARQQQEPSQGDQEILDPTTKPCQEIAQLAKRAGSIVEPVALMDISKARGSELLDLYEAKLKAAGLQTKRFAKPTFSRPCPPTLLQDISASCRSAIIALAD